MKNTDAVFVCAAGNYSNDIAVSPVYPAGFVIPNMINVAAVDNIGLLASFSNYGSKVGVLAPGVNVISTIPGNHYMIDSGTSMSAPYVSGIIALVKSCNPTLSANSIKNVIKTSSEKVIKNNIPIIDAYSSIMFNKK